MIEILRWKKKINACASAEYIAQCAEYSAQCAEHSVHSVLKEQSVLSIGSLQIKKTANKELSQLISEPVSIYISTVQCTVYI